MKKASIKTSVAGIVFASGLALVPASVQGFITIDRNTKVVFTTQIIGNESVKVATAVIKTVDSAGVSTIKQLVEKKVPAGNGFDLIVEEIESIVTQTSPGVFTVRTITNVTTTPTNSSGDPTGPPVASPEDDETETGVAEADLDLPESTQIESDPDFGETPAVSGE